MHTRHYHLTAGLRGGYIPNTIERYERKADAIARARQHVADYRDAGEQVRGREYSSRDGDLVGYWIARESGSLPGTFWDYVAVRVCSEDCPAEEEDW